MIDLKHIKNIIFDLGGVLLNIDYNKTAQEFKKLGINNFEEIYSKAKQNHLFDKLEIGAITPEEFRNSLKQLISIDITDNQIDEAWNAMLLDFPYSRLELLKKVSKEFRIFLLSNTNEIHYEIYNKQLNEVYGIEKLENLFNKDFYSFKLGMRKPDDEIFEYVLNNQNLNPEETLFIDDSIQHIETAKKLGINTFHLTEGIDITDIFKI